MDGLLGRSRKLIQETRKLAADMQELSAKIDQQQRSAPRVKGRKGSPARLHFALSFPIDEMRRLFLFGWRNVSSAGFFTPTSLASAARMTLPGPSREQDGSAFARTDLSKTIQGWTYVRSA